MTNMLFPDYQANPDEFHWPNCDVCNSCAVEPCEENTIDGLLMCVDCENERGRGD